MASNTGDLTTYAQTDFGVKNGATAMSNYDSDDADAVLDYLPASGRAAALDASSSDPGSAPEAPS